MLVEHTQGLLVETFAMADLARDINVGQKVHLDFFDSIAFAGLATTAFDVEAEA